MSQSPDYAVDSSRLPTEFEKASGRLERLAKGGMSWSGHERNCAYLNLGDGSFVNISAATGFDFLDDGRSLALCDWDHDGDLDVWVANRTGPRVRMLRNDTPRGCHFLAVRLKGNGETTNRDAIGARVEVVFGNPKSDDGTVKIVAQPKSIKTLRAGEGFLGQSTKWLYFGLGAETHIERVIVHWPGGQTQEFSDLVVDGHYQLVQGNDTVQRFSVSTGASSLAASHLPITSVSDQTQALLISRLLLPKLNYQTFRGDQTELSVGQNNAVLLNLWATWCRPCLVELSEFVKQASRLRDAGLDIIALSVDQLDEKTAVSSVDIETVLQDLRFPYRSGVASSELIDILQIVHDQLYLSQRPLPVPVSLLIDSSGRLAGIYKGPVKVERLLADVKKLKLSGDRWHATALPFSGRWIEPVQPLRDVQLASALAKQGHLDRIVEFVSQHRRILSQDGAFVELLSQLGNQLVDRGDTPTGLQFLQEALEAKPDIAQSYFNVAVVLASQGETHQAIAQYQRTIEMDFEHAESHNNLAMILQKQGKLDDALRHFQMAANADSEFALARSNLAGVLIYQGKLSEAVDHLRQALRIDPDLVDALANLGNVMLFQGQKDDAIGHYRRALEIEPDHAPVHANLGFALRTIGSLDEAAQHLRRAVQSMGDATMPLKELAWIFATHPDADARKPDEAVKLAERAAEITRYKDPGILDVLAASYAAQGQFDRAVKTAVNGISRAEATNVRELAASIRTRLELYRQRKPYFERLGAIQ